MEEREPQICKRCRYNPASANLGGYCSWDCHDHDDSCDEESGWESAAA